jgi:hypothetical protein
VPYRIRLTNRARGRLLSWNLPPAVLVDVRLRLEFLGERPADRLRPADAPFRGMGYAFELIDPDNRLAVYRFVFHIMFGQDEETLHIINGVCEASFG